MSIIKELINNTTFLTVISGVLVFIISQYFLELIINPMREYKQIKSKIGFAITMYACYYSNPFNYDKKGLSDEIKMYENVSNELRKTGSELSGYIATIPRFRIHKIKKLNEVKRYLIGLSNGLFIHNSDSDTINHNIEFSRNIEKILNLKNK